ncbi:MAG: nitrous oxide reductase family maturation protein NosD [Saprospiraceae bacterium]|nr:nitrous oxide reductase family maturation protein NosD [Saprospiraceae bacterium]
MRLTSAIGLILLLSSAIATAKTIEVCPTCPFIRIQQAIDQANEGDTIYIRKGSYSEHSICVDKPLYILGEQFPVIDGKGIGELIIIESDRVSIEGLHLQNTGISHVKDRAGIRLRRVKYFVIRNNKLDNTYFGIYLEHSSSGTIEGNQLLGQAKNETSSGNGIHLWYCKNIQVENNTVRGHRDGIYLEFADSCRIAANLAEKNIRYGLHFMFSNDDDYFQNIFQRNGAGVAVMFSRRINMWENTFAFNWGQAAYGLLLKEIYDAEIKDNTFRENTMGIFVEGSNRINYSRNAFIRNGWAIKISGGCLDNKIAGNNFLSNTFDLAVHSGVNNSFDGNFWSAYDGYDLNRDGMGDIPYRPVKLFNYIVNQTPEAMILLRSLFVDLINFSEKVSPVFTPDNVADNKPLMRRIALNHSYEITKR